MTTLMPRELLQTQELIQRQDFKRADALVSKIVRSDIDSLWIPIALLYKAEIRLSLNRPDDAIHLIEDLLERFENHTHSCKARQILADAYLMRYQDSQAGFVSRSDLDTAQTGYEYILKKDLHYDNTGWIYYQLGRIFLARGEVPKAQEFFTLALFSASTFKSLTAYCFERLAFIAHYEHRDSYKACVLLDKALHTYPADGKATWLSRLYLMRARIMKHISITDAENSALEALKIARQIVSQPGVLDNAILGEALFGLSELLSSDSQRQADVVSYLLDFFQTQRPPLGIDVTWSRAYEMLGNAYLQLGDYELALRAYDNVLHFNPDYPWLETLYLCICQAKYHLEDYQGVIDTLRHLQEHVVSDDVSMRDYRIFLLEADAYKALSQLFAMRQSVAKALDVAPRDLVDSIQTMYLS